MKKQKTVTADTTKPSVAVVGAINMDISACSLNPIVSCDSNPGHVYHAPGGVAHNIARNLTLLDVSVRFITVFGDDSNGTLLKQNCLECGVDISSSLTVSEAKSSTYVCISGADGDMVAAINDMDIYKYLTPEYLKTVIADINKCKLCIADTNISQECLIFLAEHCTIPLFIEPVSTHKAKKLPPILNKIHTLTPNVLEAQILSGVSVCSFEYDGYKQASEYGTIDPDALKRAANFFLEEGITQVYISLGEAGIFCADYNQRFVIPSHRIKNGIGNTTGAGDSQMAAIAWAFLQNLDLKQSAQTAIATSSICMESNEAINPNLNIGVLNERIRKIS